MANGRQLRISVPEDIVEKIERIAEELEKANPGAEANISSITRHAISEYVRRHEAERDYNSVFVEIPLGLFDGDEDLADVVEHLQAIRDSLFQTIFIKTGVEDLRSAFPEFNAAINKAQDLMIKTIEDKQKKMFEQLKKKADK